MIDFKLAPQYKHAIEIIATRILRAVFQGDALVAQAAGFFSAGFETSSSVMALGVYELCRRVSIWLF